MVPQLRETKLHKRSVTHQKDTSHHAHLANKTQISSKQNQLAPIPSQYQAVNQTFPQITPQKRGRRQRIPSIQYSVVKEHRETSPRFEPVARRRRENPPRSEPGVRLGRRLVGVPYPVCQRD
jgi:hypothetical protein